MNSKETEEQFRAEWEHDIVHPFREKVSEMLDCCNVMTERLDRMRGSPNSRLRLELVSYQLYITSQDYTRSCYLLS